MQPNTVVSDARAPQKRKRGRYKIEKFDDLYQCTDEDLGEGSCGTVKTYFSRDKKKEFAVKIVPKVNNATRLRVLKEIEVLHYCKGHENVVQMQEFYEEENCFYVVFEKMKGGSLLSQVEKYGSLDEHEASRIVKDVASALKFLHGKNIAHRDVKLENILCSGEDLFPIKLCDFDLCSDPNGSSCCSEHDAEAFSSAVGSIDYMAPEVVKVWLDESSHYTKQCDMWSLGVVMYILLSDSYPFAVTPGEVCYCRNGNIECEYCREARLEAIKSGEYSMGMEWDFISDEAIDLVTKLLEKDPQKRFTAEQVLEHPWMKNPIASRAVSSPISFSSTKKRLEAMPFSYGTSSKWSNLYSDDEANLTEGVFELELNDSRLENVERKACRVEEGRKWRLESFDSGNISGFSPVGSPDGP